MKKQKEFIENNDCKLMIHIAELKCYIFVDAAKIDTPEKKTEYVKKYVDLINECRDRNRD